MYDKSLCLSLCRLFDFNGRVMHYIILIADFDNNFMNWSLFASFVQAK